ncbi:uridylate kinase [Methanospirillum purgamenti]|uniref:Uridylate kinase n=1 Tax=Methanospirillum hungatei TaxID=2203 RepID=A0A8F5VKV4_METHU|nr:uridylate kinase [Methanospirillum hungatei]QXO93891.1 uridylate kinase [Methanospirillum hungatei]
MHGTQAIVLKIGGSLIKHAPDIIRTIKDSQRDILIIPGGGVFADEIREQGVIGTAAHFMAIAAMDQYGWLLSTYGIPVTITPAFGTGPRILLPYDHMLQVDPLPHSWDITSDTISAYFAHLLSVSLILLKSLDYIQTQERQVTNLFPGMVTHDLDPAFIPYVFDNHISGHIIRGSDNARLADLLRGKQVPGTIFGGTI